MRNLSFLLLSLLATAASAQEPQGTEAPAPARRSLDAAPAGGQIRVDGRFDEAAWAGAQVADGFTQTNPRPGAPASERTEVRILTGPDALYVAARMFDSAPDSIAGQLSRRDVGGTYSDRFVIYLDSRNDHRTAFMFAVNPRGVKQDGYRLDDRNEDSSWDAVWDVATTTDSLGWTAEFRIPFSQLRFSNQAGGQSGWGLMLLRDIARREEGSSWAPYTPNAPSFVGAFGELRGLEGVRAPKRLEILPYTSARLERAPGDRANPFYSNNEWRGSMGADVQYGLPGGLTLTATVNPDFGQVEVDPAVVNLTAFEVFLAERRPFFVEGNDVFRFGEIQASERYSFNQFFYTRRVGRAPQLTVGGSSVRFADAPEQSTILGAAKVSGKTAGGWSVGLMDAVTSREEARYLGLDGERGAAGVEPLSNYLVGRLRRDLNRGNTVLGGIFTATNRDMGEDGEFKRTIRSSAYIGGVDGEHSWKRRAWVVSGFAAGSRINGSRNVISVAQRTSARYFTRPDADYLTYDTTRTSLEGFMGAVALAKNGNVNGSIAYQVATPGFESNDLGFQTRVDYHAVSASIGRRVNRPVGAFRDYGFSVFGTHTLNFGGDPVYDLWSAGANGTFRNLWRGRVTLSYAPWQYNDRLTFGGPIGKAPPEGRIRVDLSSDPRKKFIGSVAALYSEDRSGAFEQTVGVGAALRPSTSLEIALSPTLTRRRDTDQYVTSVGDPRATATYGRRYVFADVEQTRLSMVTRVNWTFTPNLSLQVYAQPYVNAADFSGYKEFAAPRTFDFNVYGRDVGTIAADRSCASGASSPRSYAVDPDGSGPSSCFQVRDRDFTLRSLRGNAVLRWEYRPGSAVFFVWQQLRSGERPAGEFDFGRDTGGLFQEPARNVFLI
ncbi:MAG TPA: DUF5916 domain-containing protein, partial [Longimicrobiaceae bacterium]|nr:DUF5916 domain-containing protein [Longimicrobiaceae bacterium]